MEKIQAEQVSRELVTVEKFGRREDFATGPSKLIENVPTKLSM
jgi:hypothetical protein